MLGISIALLFCYVNAVMEVTNICIIKFYLMISVYCLDFVLILFVNIMIGNNHIVRY